MPVQKLLGCPCASDSAPRSGIPRHRWIGLWNGLLFVLQEACRITEPKAGFVRLDRKGLAQLREQKLSSLRVFLLDDFAAKFPDRYSQLNRLLLGYD